MAAKIVSFEDVNAEFDAIEKKLGLVNTSYDREPLSTGLLSLDLVLSGGVRSGAWYTFFGQEQSSKSTLAQTVLSKVMLDNIPRLAYFDYEGSMDQGYMESIGHTMGSTFNTSDIFGVRSPVGKWVVQPRLRYYAAQIGEDFFDFLYRMETILPDKLPVGDKWYLVYDKEMRQKFNDVMDQALYKETGRVHVPVENGYPQAFIVVDSYPAMMPRNMDEEDKTQGMANQARMFSDQLRRVKGRLRQKGITVVGINQLRQKPGVMYGSPWYEPGGEALKFISDARIEMTPRSVLGGKGQIEEEPSINGGKDVYRYVHIRAKKNKLSTPNLEAWTRLWIADDTGVAHGYDPVFDTYWMLKETGKLSGTKNRMKIDLPHTNGGQHKPLTWLNLKKLVLGDNPTIKETLKSIGIEKPFYLRKVCFSMMRRGQAMTDFFATMSGGTGDHTDAEQD